jgi:hypothetical protein
MRRKNEMTDSQVGTWVPGYLGQPRRETMDSQHKHQQSCPSLNSEPRAQQNQKREVKGKRKQSKTTAK